jgi:molecular chaperone DnaJ
MASDFYIVLGVPRDANLSQIRRAYRLLAHRYDPQHATPPIGGSFQDVDDAYASLSQTSARAEHDQALRKAEAMVHPPASGPSAIEARNLFDDFDRFHPSRDDVMRAFMQNQTDHLPKARPVRPVKVEVVLNEHQASAGNLLPLRVPWAHECAVCAGTGRTGFFHCDACDGNGVTWSVAGVDVIIPPHASREFEVPVSLEEIGVTTLYLNLQVRVATGIPPA